MTWSTGPVGGHLGIGRGAAQRLARAELSKPIYHPRTPLTERILAAIAHLVSRIFDSVSAVAPGGWWGLVALAALAVIVFAGLRAWLGPVGRAHRGPGPLTPANGARTAREHRQEAERLARTGDHTAAIIECVRAMAAELDERGVLAPSAGRTADEFAVQAGAVMPAHAAALRGAATLFDEVCYGQRPGTAAGYNRVRELDRQVVASAPRVSKAGVSEASGPAPPGLVMAGERR